MWWRPSAPHLGVAWTRAAVVGFSLVAAALALNPPGDIVEITIFSGSLYAVASSRPSYSASIGSAAPLAVLWSMAVGISTLIIWIGADLRQNLHGSSRLCCYRR